MLLSRALDDVELVFDGAPCGHALRKPAQWFRHVGSVRCPACGRTFKISYPAKVKLFEDALNRKNGMTA